MNGGTRRRYGEDPAAGRLRTGHRRAADVLAGDGARPWVRCIERRRAVRVRRDGRGTGDPEGVHRVVDIADVELAPRHRYGAVGRPRQEVRIQQLAVGGIDHLEGVALPVRDLAVHVRRGADDCRFGLMGPQHGPRAGVEGADRPAGAMSVYHLVPAGVVQDSVGEDPRRDGAVAARGAVTADGDLVLPQRWVGVGLALLEVGSLPGVDAAVLVGCRHERGSVGGGRERRGRAPIRVGHGRLEGELPRSLVTERDCVERHDRLRLGLGVVVERPRCHEDGVRRGVHRRRCPHASAELALRHKDIVVDHLMGGEAHLHQVTLDQRVVTVARHADVGEPLVDKRARPVVVGAGLGVIPGVDAPQDGAGARVQCVPVGPPASHVKHTVLHVGARRDADVDGIASRVGRDPQVRALPDLRPGGGVDRILEAVPRPDVGGRAYDRHRGRHAPSGLECPFELQRGRIGHAQAGVDRGVGAFRVLEEHWPVLVGDRRSRRAGQELPDDGRHKRKARKQKYRRREDGGNACAK